MNVLLDQRDHRWRVITRWMDSLRRHVAREFPDQALETKLFACQPYYGYELWQSSLRDESTKYQVLKPGETVIAAFRGRTRSSRDAHLSGVPSKRLLPTYFLVTNQRLVLWAPGVRRRRTLGFRYQDLASFALECYGPSTTLTIRTKTNSAIREGFNDDVGLFMYAVCRQWNRTGELSCTLNQD